MNRLMKPAVALVALLTLVAGTQVSKSIASLASEDVTNAATLDGVNLGTYVYGPKVAADDLKGRVVVFEYWGDGCPPCIRAIPHLVKVQKKHGDDKIVIVANQVWTDSVDLAKQAWKKAGGNDKISVINHGKLKGASMKGVPHSFIFSHEGQLIWEGHPLSEDFDKTVDKAVKAVPSKG